MDYSHIPIHLRISDRWLIDPTYNAVDYYRREQIIDKYNGGGAWTRRIVPDLILAYLDECRKTIPADAAQMIDSIECAAAELHMFPEDLRHAVDYYCKKQ